MMEVLQELRYISEILNVMIDSGIPVEVIRHI